LSSDRTNRTGAGAYSRLPTILANKVRRLAKPTRASVRERLLPSVAALRSTRLVLLKALAGYGKTTLLRQYAERLSQNEADVAWLRLDSADNEAAKALAYLVAAFAEVDPSVGEELAAFMSALPPLPPEDVLAALIGRLERHERDIFLLVDDYHAVTDAKVHQTFFYLLRNLPAHVHLVVASRHMPPWNLAEIAEGGEVLVFEESDIRFRADEIADYAVTWHGLHLDEESLSFVRRQTDGWISAIKLVSHSIEQRQGRLLSDRMDPSVHRSLIDYLASAVFDRLDAETRDFLLQTAPLERLSPSLCDAVTGSNNAAAMLDRLVRENLFIEPLDAHGGWHRYHALFSEFLLDRLARHPALDRSATHRRASYWFEVNRQPYAAAAHAMAAGDLARNQALIEAAILDMVRGSQIALALGWFGTLPEEFSANKPDILIPMAWCNVYSRRVEGARPLLAKARRLLEDNPDRLGPADLARRTEFLVEVEIAETELTWATKGERPDARRLRAIKEQLAPDWNFLRAYVELLSSRSDVHQDQLDAAFAAASDAVVLARKVPNPFIANLAIEQMAQVRYLQGRLVEARKLCEQAIDGALGETGEPLPVVGNFHLLLAKLHYEANDLAASRRHLDAATHLTALNESPDVLSEIEILAAQLKAAVQGDPAALASLISYNNARLDRSPPLSINRVRSHQAWFHVGAGELASAEGVLKQVDAPLGRTAPPATLAVDPLAEIHYLALCRYQIAAGKTEVAVNWLRHLLRIAERSGRIRSCIVANGLLALAQTERQQPESALRYLRDMLALGQDEGFARTIVDLGPDLIRLLADYRARLAEAGEGPDTALRLAYVARLLDVSRGERAPLAAVPASAPRRAPAAPGAALRDYDSLTKREMQILEMISSGRRNSEVARELLIAESSVRWHVRNLYTKLDVHNRTEASAKGRSLKLIH